MNKEYYCKVNETPNKNETNNYTSSYLQKDILNETRPSNGERLNLGMDLEDELVLLIEPILKRLE